MQLTVAGTIKCTDLINGMLHCNNSQELRAGYTSRSGIRAAVPGDSCEGITHTQDF